MCSGLLGSRLEAAEDSALQAEACLCYICAGSVEQLVSCWSKAQDSSSPLLLQVRLQSNESKDIHKCIYKKMFCFDLKKFFSSVKDLVEKVVILRQAVEKTQSGVAPAVGTLLAEKMSQYAGLLASQGSLQTAISYLPTNTDQASTIKISLLLLRIYQSYYEHTKMQFYSWH